MVVAALAQPQFKCSPLVCPNTRSISSGFWFTRVARKDYIKRVIAVAGDTVAMRDGQVYVDGQLQHEGYLPDSYRDHADFPQEIVPRGDIFVLGDHRAVSDDSRIFGFVPIRNIRGQAVFTWWPPQAIGTIR